MNLVGLNVEDTGGLSERSSNIVVGLVCMAVVDNGQHLGVAAHQHGGGDSDDGSYKTSLLAMSPSYHGESHGVDCTIFLVKVVENLMLLSSEVVVGYPESGNTGPERTGEL